MINNFKEDYKNQTNYIKASEELKNKIIIQCEQLAKTEKGDCLQFHNNKYKEMINEDASKTNRRVLSAL